MLSFVVVFVVAIVAVVFIVVVVCVVARDAFAHLLDVPGPTPVGAMEGVWRLCFSDGDEFLHGIEVDRHGYVSRYVSVLWEGGGSGGGMGWGRRVAFNYQYKHPREEIMDDDNNRVLQYFLSLNNHLREEGLGRGYDSLIISSLQYLEAIYG